MNQANSIKDESKIHEHLLNQLDQNVDTVLYLLIFINICSYMSRDA